MTSTPTQSGQTIRDHLRIFQDYTASWGYPMDQEAHERGIDMAEAAINSYVVSVLEELKREATVVPLFCEHTADECHCKRVYVVLTDDIDAAISQHKGEQQ